MVTTWRCGGTGREEPHGSKYSNVELDPDVDLDVLGRLIRMLSKRKVRKEEEDGVELAYVIYLQSLYCHVSNLMHARSRLNVHQWTQFQRILTAIAV